MIGEEVIAYYGDAGDGEELFETSKLVRCKDCRHATYTVKNQRTHETFYACPYNCVQHEGKFFCSYGERKGDE